MKHIFIIFIFFVANSHASEVVKCGDVQKISDEAKEVLHDYAQKRAQKEIEHFTGRKVVNPYGTFGNKTLKGHSGLIEIYWCESSYQPLHDAWYSYYSRNESAFGKRSLQGNICGE